VRTLAEVTLLLGRADRVEIHSWVERGWVRPEGRRGGEPLFSELDVARLCLICLRISTAYLEQTWSIAQHELLAATEKQS
jgi:hypothetical protein